MHERRAALLALVCLCLFALVPIGLHAQSATTGLVQGTVADPTGAVIPGASIVITNKATGVTTTTSTDAKGRFVFPAVTPGSYSLRVTATGFQSYVVSNVNVAITQSYTFPVALKVGTTSQTITVTEVMGSELQTTNASIGTVMGGNDLLRMPSTQRNVTSLLSLEPGVTPMSTSDVMGGQVAGADPDQTTFLVDGGDATSDLEGTNSYASVPGQPEPAPFIAVNIESTQEFRVTTASPTSSFSRSQGGEVSIVSKSGTNQYHGSAYEYYTGSTLGANSWTFNRIHHPKPHTVNNRFGFTFGGAFPKLKDRLWFFGNYEGRRFRQSSTVGTDVPTQLARQGILQFKDASGNVIPYNLATSTQCGANGNQACDPRGIGIDPLIQKYWANEPLPNVPGTGDGLNSEEFLQSFGEPANEDYGLLRLDLKINNRWKFYTTYRQQKLGYFTNSQFSIIPGNQTLLSSTPVQPRFATFMLTGQIGSHFTSQTHGSWMRDWWAWGRQAPGNPPGVSGIGGALQVSGEGRTGSSGAGKPWADPTNYNTQNARSRTWAGKDYYIAEDASWLHGSHNISFGGSDYYWNIIHLRTDDVLGGLTNGPIYWVSSYRSASGGFVHTGGDYEPMPCSTAVTANCLKGSDLTRWDAMYSAMLGMVDHSSQVATSDGNFNPNPLGTPLIDNVHIGSFYTYVQDMWQARPSLTFTYGLSYGAQFPPKEVNGKQAMQVFSATGQPVQNLNAYYLAKQQALDTANFTALSGLNNFSFIPIRHIPGFTRPVNTYWGQLGPRISVAWQPGFSNKVFGNHQTVIRAGYSILWDRTNAVGLVMTPLLGTGLAQIVGCHAPTTSGVCSGAHTDPTDAFRIGIDGNSVPNTGPGLVNPKSGYPVTLGTFQGVEGFNLDPAYKPAWSHNVTFDIQRSFANNWLIDLGYIGRFSRNLENGGDLQASDIFAKDPISGQTLGQAFDAVSKQIRAGVAPASVTPQPYFEDMAAPGTGGPAFCQATYGTSCTATAAIDDTSDFLYGAPGSMMQFEYNFDITQPLDNQQFLFFNFYNFSGGWANYNAAFLTATKSFSNGLQLNFNYTWSHSLGTESQLGQQYIVYGNPSPYDQSTGYGTSIFDRRHVFNASWYYELPIGKGKRFSSGNGFIDRIIGGWYSSGIWSWQSGQPLCIGADGDYGDIATGQVSSTCAQTATPLFGTAGLHSNIVGSGGIATNGNASKGGSGLNIFADPASVFNGLSRPLLTQNLRPFDPNFTEKPTWNVDLSLGKNVATTERMKAIFTADFFNAFNLFQPGDPSLDMTDPAGFGVITGQGNSPRTIQLGLRFEF